MSKNHSVRLLVPFLLLLISFATNAAESFIDRSILGKSFEIPGPNCFATALRVTGLAPTFRAVDESEFKAYLTAFCSKVETRRVGDIGAYISGNIFTHAYVLASDQTGIDKPGVDYFGKTPISEKSLQNIDYVSYASRECRQYGGDDISVCANERVFYRCQKPTFKDLPEINAHNATVAQWDADVTVLLETSLPTSSLQSTYKKLAARLDSIETQVTVLGRLDIDPNHQAYFEARLHSLKAQLSFVEIAIRAQLAANLHE